MKLPNFKVPTLSLTKKAAASAALTLFLLVAPAGAFILPVIDPAALIKLITTNSQLAKQIIQYAQMIQQYEHMIQTTDSQFKLWTQGLKKLGNRAAWESAALAQLHSNVGNYKGETEQLNAALNGKPAFSLDQVWKKATVAINGTDYMANDTVGSSGHLANLAGVEMTDAFSADALNAIGTYRQNETQNTPAIQSLLARTQSTADDDNTLTAQQNMTNAALMQQLTLQQSTNSLNIAILEQLTAANTWQRNAATELSNIYAGNAQFAASNPSAYVGGGSTLNGYVIP